MQYVLYTTYIFLVLRSQRVGGTYFVFFILFFLLFTLKIRYSQTQYLRNSCGYIIHYFLIIFN